MTKIFLTTACLALVMAGWAQSPRVVTAEAYARAESMLTYNTEPLIDRAGVQPVWLPGGLFWYRVLTPAGAEFVLVDAAKKTRTVYLSRAALASGLASSTRNTVTLSDGEERRGRGGRGSGNEVASPDGKRIAFLRDYNLWVREVATGQEVQLTTDG